MNNNHHEKNYFCTSKRLMSLISAGLLLVFFFVFMTGYVWGKRVALEDVLRAVEQKTFADQISGSLYALSSPNDTVKKEDSMESELVVLQVVENQVTESPEKEVLKEEQKEIQTDAAVMIVDNAIAASPSGVAVESGDERNNDNSLGNYYYAQLVGFGSKKAADQFVVRLNNSGLESMVKERISKGSQGKKRVWYQVVTQRYTNKEELGRLVAHITKKEHLSGVQIIAC